MNVEATRINCVTGGHVTGAMVPVHYATDREVLDLALVSIGLTDPVDARLLWVRNTLDVSELACSAAYFEEAQQRTDLEVLSEPEPLPLGSDGNLPDKVLNGS